MQEKQFKVTKETIYIVIYDATIIDCETPANIEAYCRTKESAEQIAYGREYVYVQAASALRLESGEYINLVASFNECTVDSLPVIQFSEPSAQDTLRKDKLQKLQQEVTTIASTLTPEQAKKLKKIL